MPSELTPQQHRAQAIEANNAVWDALASDPEEAVRAAYTAQYHWARAADATDANAARAHYMVAKAWLAAGQPQIALAAGEQVLAVCRAAGLRDFDLAYAWEAVARARLALGDSEGGRAAWREALAVEVADPEDREIVEADLADAPDDL